MTCYITCYVDVIFYHLPFYYEVLYFTGRWRECVSDTDNVLGFALGAMFVNTTFDGDSKPEAEAMIKVYMIMYDFI